MCTLLIQGGGAEAATGGISDVAMEFKQGHWVVVVQCVQCVAHDVAQGVTQVVAQGVVAQGVTQGFGHCVTWVICSG